MGSWGGFRAQLGIGEKQSQQVKEKEMLGP